MSGQSRLYNPLGAGPTAKEVNRTGNSIGFPITESCPLLPTPSPLPPTSRPSPPSRHQLFPSTTPYPPPSYYLLPPPLAHFSTSSPFLKLTPAPQPLPSTSSPHPLLFFFTFLFFPPFLIAPHLAFTCRRRTWRAPGVRNRGCIRH